MVSKHDCSSELRSANLKATPARIAFMQLFESHNAPLDASHLIEKHTDIQIDRVTVFRTLNSLVDNGLVRKLEFGEGKARYELAGNDHHHFICDSCGDIEDISDCNIESQVKNIQNEKSFKIKRHSLEFFGICKSCQH